MKTIVEMANGAVTATVLKGIPEDPPRLDSCPLRNAFRSRQVARARRRRRNSFNGDLAGPTPVESVSTDLC